MKHRICLTVLFVVILIGSVPVSAQQSRGRGIYGDWMVKQEFNGMTFESILSFSRDQEGNYTGYYISLMGMSELQDIKFEDGKLSFSRTRRGRDGETSTSTFTGTIADGVLSGTMTGGRGDTELKGKRSPRVPRSVARAVGQWELTYSMGEREITSPLIIKADAEGQLTAQSPSDRVQHTITDVAYEQGELSFKRTTKWQEREFESTFTGNIEGDAITGTFKSERGEIPVKGTRIGAAAIGTWNLDVTSERGARKQRLRINPDMSALYGSMAVKEVKLEDNQLSFKLVMAFGDQTFEMDFAGTLSESKLTGKLTSERGTQEVTGTKVPRRSRRGSQ